MSDSADIALVNLDYADQPQGLVPRLWLWVLRLVGQIRRQVLCRLRPGYVSRARRLRRGECRQCGACCHLTFHCPLLTPDGLCRHYQKRTLTCRDFPIDALDLRLTRVPCGHWFEAEDADGADSAR